jgi:hypothetical protein
MSEPNLKQYELIEDGMFEEIDQDSVILERMALEQSTSSNSDPDDFIFRALKTAKGQNFTFFHHGEDGKETSIVDRQDVFALRGVPIKMRFGYSLFDGGSTNICRTVGAQIGDRRIQSTHPLARPIYSPGLIGDNVSENTPRQEIIALNPIGSRGKSCAECVSSGEHIHLNEPKKEGDPTTPSYCSLQTSVIFCVFEVGILKPELKNGIPYDGVEWIKASEFKNVYGAPMADGPFIANIRMSKKAATVSISNKRLQPLVEPFNAIPAQVKTTSQVIRALYDNNLVKPMKIRGNDELMYMLVSEVWAGRPTESCAAAFEKTKNIPLWGNLNSSLGDHEVAETVKTAWRVYLAAREGGPNNSLSSSPVKNIQEEPAVTNYLTPTNQVAQTYDEEESVHVEAEVVNSSDPLPTNSNPVSNLSSIFS